MISLSSTQVLGNPELYNNYLFVDPVYGLDIVFPLTANGGGPIPEWPINATSTVNGGLFFPWGYIFTTTFKSITADPFKGPYTITFSPTGLDQRYYAILKIIYDFGDGETLVVDRGIIPVNFGASFDGNPARLNISHEYWPKDYGITTYTPRITVLNGNLATNIYNITLKFVPLSFFDFEDIKLINIAQHTQSKEETLGVFELGKENTNITNARFFSAGNTPYNTFIPSLITEFTSISGLILNLDASNALSIFKNTQNQVFRWNDISGNNNDFTQSVLSCAPVFLYDTQTSTQRKALRFTNNLSVTSVYTSLTCINSTAFNSITGGYTAFFVLSPKEISGTIFNAGTSNLIENNLNFKFIPYEGMSLLQGTTGLSARAVSTVLSAINIFTATASPNNDISFTAGAIKVALNQPGLVFVPVDKPASISTPDINKEPLLNTEISQILVYNRPLETAEFELIRTSLINKWSTFL